MAEVAPGATHRVELRASPLSSRDLAEVLDVAARATEADSVPPLSDQTRLSIGHPDTEHPGIAAPGTHLLLRQEGTIVGYGYGSDGSVELLVHPEFRGEGRGRALLETALTRVPRSGQPLRFWAHGEHPAAVRLADQLGLVSDRVLWRLRLDLAGAATELATEPRPPDDVRVRPFAPGQDEQRWLQLNRQAFADHREQASWGISELELREAEPWFDPAGFLLAERVSTGELLGTHWTKIHEKTASAERVGEVYVLATDPDAQGLGLGGVLLAAGLRYLREQGLSEVMLYTDAHNAGAVRLYRKWGFNHVSTDVQYMAP